jgi:hypothetical protein
LRVVFYLSPRSKAFSLTNYGHFPPTSAAQPITAIKNPRRE